MSLGNHFQADMRWVPAVDAHTVFVATFSCLWHLSCGHGGTLDRVERPGMPTSPSNGTALVPSHCRPKSASCRRQNAQHRFALPRGAHDIIAHAYNGNNEMNFGAGCRHLYACAGDNRVTWGQAGWHEFQTCIMARPRATWQERSGNVRLHTRSSSQEVCERSSLFALSSASVGPTGTT